MSTVPGTQQGTGADRSCTALTMKLLYGFALSGKLTLNMLTKWGQRQDQLDDADGWYPWTEEEIARKIEWCLGQEYVGELGDKLHAIRDLGDMEAQADKSVEPFDVDMEEVTARIVEIDRKDQLATASKFFHSEYEVPFFSVTFVAPVLQRLQSFVSCANFSSCSPWGSKSQRVQKSQFQHELPLFDFLTLRLFDPDFLLVAAIGRAGTIHRLRRRRSRYWRMRKPKTDRSVMNGLSHRSDE